MGVRVLEGCGGGGVRVWGGGVRGGGVGVGVRGGGEGVGMDG